MQARLINLSMKLVLFRLSVEHVVQLLLAVFGFDILSFARRSTQVIKLFQ